MSKLQYSNLGSKFSVVFEKKRKFKVLFRLNKFRESMPEYL